MSLREIHESVIAAFGLTRGAPALRHNPYVTKRGASPRGYLNLVIGN
jgi:hypothetical protein